MATISMTNTSKIGITMTNRTKVSGAGGQVTWNTAVGTWDEQGLATWNNPRVVFTTANPRGQKNAITMTNRSK